MAFDNKVIISTNRDVILEFDFIFDPIEGKNFSKKKIRSDSGVETDAVRADYKMSDSLFNDYKTK